VQLYDPLMATFILAAGGVSGGAGCLPVFGLPDRGVEDKTEELATLQIATGAGQFSIAVCDAGFSRVSTRAIQSAVGAWLDIDMKNTWYILGPIDVVFINLRDVCFYPKNMQDVKP